MQFERQKTSYAIEIDEDKFEAMIKAEDQHIGEIASLLTKLEKLDAFDIEYDGHFSNFVYLTLNVDDDTSGRRHKILSTIQKHLDLCVELTKDKQ